MHTQDLNEESFEIHPVWTWDESTEGYVSVDDYEPLPDNISPFFLKAKFETQDTKKFNGYLVGTNVFYAFGIFINKNEFGVNFRLPDLYEEDLSKIRRILNEPNFNLFPLIYTSELHFKSCENISGVFDLKNFWGRDKGDANF